MTVEIEQDPERSTAAIVRITRGDPFALVLKIDPSRNAACAQLFDTLADREWLGQVRARPGDTGDPLATLTKSETVIDDEDDPDNGKRVIVFSCADSSALLPSTTSYTDVQVTTGPAAGTTWFDGSRVVVRADVSRAT